MWYEDTEEEVTEKEGATNKNKVPGENSQGQTNSPFPNTDPTKAFEDDVEEVAGGPISGNEMNSLKNTIRELDEKVNMNYNRYLRALAELENYKKRVVRERADLMKYAGEDLLLEILPVVDNLERTLEHAKEDTDVSKVVEGVALIYRQFIQALEKSGVTLIAEVNIKFDTAIHQALQKVEDKSVPDDTVVEILQKGYILNGKVVRPAMVKVAKHGG